MKKKKNVPSFAPVAHTEARAKPRLSKLLSNRKFRCGGFSLVLTALMIALVVCVNCLASALENTYALTLDCSYNALTTQSETTKAVLDSLSKDVHLYLLNSGASDSSDSALLDTDDLTALLQRYAASSARVTWSEENLIKNPTFKTRFQDMLGENDITSDCLIVYCAETSRARVLNSGDYLTYSYNTDTGYYELGGYTYEKSITEAILYVTQDELPTLQLLTGHGELTADDTSILENKLTSNNYYVKRVTLLGETELDVSSPLMILCPQLDLSTKELEALYAFAKAGGNFFFISQYTDPVNLPNFNALLLSFGVVPLDGLCVAESTDAQSYYPDSPAILIPYMQATDATQTLIDSGKDVLLMTGARAFDVTAGDAADLSVDVLLKSGSAYLRAYQDGNASLDKQEGDKEGTFNLSLLSTWTQTDGTRSRMFVIGNAGIFTDDWLYANTYSSEFLLQMLRTLLGKQPINLSIVQKSAARASLSLGSLAVPTAVALLLPMLALILALCVLLPKRNL